MSNQNNLIPGILLLLGGLIVGGVLGYQLCNFDKTLPKRQAALDDFQRLNQLTKQVIDGIKHLNAEEVESLRTALEENSVKFTDIITKQHQYESQLNTSSFYMSIVFALITAAGMIVSAFILKKQQHDNPDDACDDDAYEAYPLLAKEIKRIRKRKEKIDKALQPLIPRLYECKKVIDELEPQEPRLLWYREQLEQAADRHERGRLHAGCEREFGDGSPFQLLGKLDQCRRDKQKIIERKENIMRTLASDIRKIVIDGNNLCHVDTQFVKFAILDVLVPALLQEYAVTIIFDPGFDFKVKLTKEQIAKRYESATVEITPNGRKADDLIMLAASDERAWILSSDRFVDYAGDSAIREKRLIQPTIMENRIYLTALDMNLEFRH